MMLATRRTKVREAWLPGQPPSANNLYASRGARRFLTTEGRAYKNEMRAFLLDAWKHLPSLTRGKPSPDGFELELTFCMPNLFNETYGQQKGATTRFKRIDVTGLVKIVEDLLVDMTGVDDANTVRVVLNKRWSEVPGVRIGLWILPESEYLDARPD